jgi:hypothetical protein
MNAAFSTFGYGETIPVFDYLKDRKLAKYFSRETAAAIVCLGRLLKEVEIPRGIPVYYATGITEYEDYGLPGVVRNSTDSSGKFSTELFIRKGFAEVQPITQFKLLCNMPLCFISLNYGLGGDNAVIYSASSALLCQAISSPIDSPILLGAGKSHADGSVESGFAVVSKDEVSSSRFLLSSAEAIEIFREWKEGSAK